jgi:hypothetical protein
MPKGACSIIGIVILVTLLSPRRICVTDSGAKSFRVRRKVNGLKAAGQKPTAEVVALKDGSITP